MIKSALNDNGMSSARGIASFAVVFAHSVQIFLIRLLGTDNLFVKLTSQFSNQAVMVFFVVSGFLITQSITKNTARHNGVFDFIEYISARVARIYPPLILTVILSMILYFLINYFGLPGSASNPYGLQGDLYVARDLFSIDRSDIYNALLMRNGMLQINGPLWSLYIEWRVYVLVGFLTLFLTTKGLIKKIFWLLVFLHFSRSLLAVNEHSFFYAIVWGTGGAIALAQHFGFKWQIYSSPWLKYFFLLITVLWSSFEPETFFAGGSRFGLQECVLQLIICMFWFSIILPGRQVVSVASRRWSMMLGDFSYTLYVLHFPVMLFLLSVLQNRIGNSPILTVTAVLFSIAASLCLSYLSARWFERKEKFKPIIEKPLQRLFSSLSNIMPG